MDQGQDPVQSLEAHEALADAAVVDPVTIANAPRQPVVPQGAPYVPVPNASALGGIPWPPALPVPAAVNGMVSEIITISDRKVRLPPAATTEVGPSMYSLCRAWVRNETDLRQPEFPPGETLAQTSPKRTEAANTSPAPTIGPLPDESNVATATLQEHNFAHWKAVGKHTKESRRPWDGSRLQALLPD